MSSQINIQFKPSAKQYRALKLLQDDTTRFIGYGGSAFSGKSYFMCYFITMMALAYPETAYGLCRKELTTLKKTTLLTLFKVFQESGITGEHYTYNQQLNTITFYNGSVIFLIDVAHKPSDPLATRLGGYELTLACVDESAEVSYDIIKILWSRCNRKNNAKYGIKAKLLETFNPDKGHVYQRYYKPFRDGEETDDKKFIKALPHDNPSPEVDEYIANIMASGDRTTIERLIQGNFEYDDNPYALIDYDKILDMYTNDFVETGTMYLTADVAMMGADAFVIMAWSGLRVLEIKSIAKSDGKEVIDALTEMKNKYQVPQSNIIYDADGVGNFISGFLKGAREFHNNGRAEKGENYKNLKTQCYFKLADYINKGQIFVEDKKYREKLIEELEVVRRKPTDPTQPLQIISKEDTKQLLGRSPDYSDAMMLRMQVEVVPKLTAARADFL